MNKKIDLVVRIVVEIVKLIGIVVKEKRKVTVLDR